MGCAITALAFPIMLYAQLVRGLSPTRRRAAAGADGDHVDRARPDGRPAHRHHPPPDHHEHRLHVRDRLAGLAVAGDDPGLRDLADPAADGAARHRQRPDLGTQQRDRHPQPAAAAGGCRAPASTTPPGRSARCWARPPSRCSSTPGSPPRAWCSPPPRAPAAAAACPPSVLAPFSDAMATALLLAPAVMVVGLLAALAFEAPTHRLPPRWPRSLLGNPDADPGPDRAGRGPRARLRRGARDLRLRPPARRDARRARGHGGDHERLALLDPRARGRRPGRRRCRERRRVGRPVAGARARHRSPADAVRAHRRAAGRCGATSGWVGTSSSSTAG